MGNFGFLRHFHHQKSPTVVAVFRKTAGTCRISSGGTPAEAMAEANMEAEAAWNGVSENREFSPQIIPWINRVFHYFHHPFWGISVCLLEANLELLEVCFCLSCRNEKYCAYVKKYIYINDLFIGIMYHRGLEGLGFLFNLTVSEFFGFLMLSDSCIQIQYRITFMVISCMNTS